MFNTRMEDHINVLAILYIILSSVKVILCVLVATGLLFTTFDKDVLFMFGWFGYIICTVLLISSLPGIIAGIGLLRRKSWSRMLTIIIGFFNLVDIPLGTILGGYTIWVLLIREDSLDYFNN